MSRRAKSQNDSGKSSVYSYSDTASSSMESSSLDASPRSVHHSDKSTAVVRTSAHELDKHEPDITSAAFAKQNDDDDDDVEDITSNAFARSNSSTKDPPNVTEPDTGERISQRKERQSSLSTHDDKTRNDDMYDYDKDNKDDVDNNDDDEMYDIPSNAHVSSIANSSIEVPAMNSREELKQSTMVGQEDTDEVPIHISPMVDDTRQSRHSRSKRRHKLSTSSSSSVSSRQDKSSRKRRRLRRRKHTYMSLRSRKHHRNSSRVSRSSSRSESKRHDTHTNRIDTISPDDAFDVSKERMNSMTDDELKKGFKDAMSALHKAAIDLYVSMYQTRSKISLERVVTPSEARKLVVIAAYDVKEGPSRLLLILRSLLERKHSPILIDSFYTNVLQQHKHTFLNLKHTSNRATLPYIIASNVKLSNTERRTWLDVMMDDPVVGTQFDLNREVDHRGGNLLLRSYTDLRIDDASWYTKLIKKHHVWVNHHCPNHETLKGYLLRDKKESKSRRKRKLIPLSANDITTILECLNSHGGKTVSELNA